MKTKAIAFALVGGLALALASVTPGSAVTTVAPASEPVVATFGDAWMLELEVSATLTGEHAGYSPPINESSGTVDVFIEQVPGTFLEGLTVQANGRVFVTQPPGQPLLAPGTYDLRAVFTPAGGTGLETTQVRVPAAITITPRELAATIAVQMGASAAVPTITLSLAGAEETELDIVPPGVWNLSVREAAGSEAIFTRQVLQTTTLDPVVVELTDDLRPDVDHVLLAEFVPVAEYAAGVVVTGAGEIPFRTAPQGFGELLVTPIDIPVWALIVALVGIAAGIAGLVTALVVRRGRTRRTAKTVVESNSLFDAPEVADATDPASTAEGAPSSEPETTSPDSSEESANESLAEADDATADANADAESEGDADVDEEAPPAQA